MEYLFVLLIAALGGLVFFKRKADNAEALNENVETKSKVLDLQKFVEKNLAALEAEKNKRNQLELDLSTEKAKEVTTDEIVDFLNSKKED